MDDRPLMIKILVPDQNASKMMKFESNNTTEEVVNRILKHLPIANITEYGLFVPIQEGTNNGGVWLTPNTPLSKYNLVSMKTVIEFKKKSDAADQKKESPQTNKPVANSSAAVPEKSIIRTLLGRFFEARPSQEELIQKKVLQTEVYTEKPLPLSVNIVNKCIAYIEAKALTAEGIYRISGQQLDVRKLCRSFGGDFNLDSILNPHTVSSALKLYFREMIPPLIPFELYDSFLEASGQVAGESRVAAVRAALSKLEPLRRQVFEILCRHLTKVSKHSSENKMTIANLAIVVAPTLLRAKVEVNPVIIVMENEKKCKVMECCIEFFDQVFADAETESATPTSNSSSSSNVSLQPTTQTAVSSATPSTTAAPFAVQSSDEDFGFYGDILELCMSRNKSERLQAAKELVNLFQEDMFRSFLEQIEPNYLAQVIIQMTQTLSSVSQ